MFRMHRAIQLVQPRTSPILRTFAGQTEAERVATHAKNEVRQARRLQREAEDEACLFNAAYAAAKGSEDVELPASHGADRQLRRAAIDAHVARQVALLMGSLLGPAYRPGVPPPGMSYAVDVQPSVALGPEAGRGLIVRGACQPGDVVAFYPGSVYTPAEVRALCGYAGVAQATGSPDYLLGRAGGLLFDGLGSTFDSPAPGEKGHNPVLHEALIKRDAQAVDVSPSNENSKEEGGGGEGSSSEGAAMVGDAWPLPPGVLAGAGNGWANGHFANHPPKGTPANVIGWPYDFPPQLPARLRHLLPNCYAGRRADDVDDVTLESTNGGASTSQQPRARLCRHSIVLVAATHLRDGDECFLDYGFEHDPVGRASSPTSSGAASSSIDGKESGSTKNGDAAADAAPKSSAGLPAWFHAAKLRGDALVTGDEDDNDEGGGSSRSVHDKQLEVVKRALADWREGFEKEHGRKPSRHDLAADRVAASLFEEFGRLNKLEWDE